MLVEWGENRPKGSTRQIVTYDTVYFHFELIITDLVMPDITGTELRAEVLKIRPEMPVIICTGYSSKITEEYAMEHGICEFIKKPYDKVRLSEAIREALNGRA